MGRAHSNALLLDRKTLRHNRAKGAHEYLNKIKERIIVLLPRLFHSLPDSVEAVNPLFKELYLPKDSSLYESCKRYFRVGLFIGYSKSSLTSLVLAILMAIMISLKNF